MATESTTAVGHDVGTVRWLYAAALGALAGLPRVFREDIAGGLETVGVLSEGSALAGLFDPGIGIHPLGHLGYSVLFGLLFALLVDYDELATLVSTPRRAAGAGVTYGLGLWLGGVVVLWPLVLAFVGLLGPAAPFLHPGTFVGYLLFGLVLGGGYGLLLSE